MTAAGIAFIAGGIATLICLRSVLFGRGKQPEGGPKQLEGRPKQLEGRPKQLEGRPNQGRERQRPEGREKQRPEGREKQRPDGRERQRSGAREKGPAGQRPGGGAKVRSEAGAKVRSEGSAKVRSEGSAKLRSESRTIPPAVTETAELILPTARRASREKSDRPETPRQYRRHASHDDDLPGGLASIGLAADEIEEPEPPAIELRAAPAGPEPEVILGEEESRPISVRRVDRSDRTYGDRVDGWIRPEYHDDPPEPASGEYWTPLPMEELDLPEGDPEPSARGYGWPIPVERLPAVPDYEPATGFDLTPVTSEPTELVPVWPPMPDEERRVRLPRSWANRDTKPAGNRFLENDSRRLDPEDADQRFRVPTGEPERRRPRPRPRPAANDPDNVYVSRHAADPPH
jgi:hypothetical protein